MLNFPLLTAKFIISITVKSFLIILVFTDARSNRLTNPFTPRVKPWANKCGCNFWVCGWNTSVWPFKWKLSSSILTWCCLFLTILQNEIHDFFHSFELNTLGSERVKLYNFHLELSRLLRSFAMITCYQLKNESASFDQNTLIFHQTLSYNTIVEDWNVRK